MKQIAQWCFRHRYIVIGLWIVLLVAVFWTSSVVGAKYSNSFTLPNTDSTKALNLLKNVHTGTSGETDTIVWHVSSGTVENPVVAQHISTMLNQVALTPEVQSIVSPFSPQGHFQISPDGKTAYAQVNFSKNAQELDTANVKQVIKIAQAARQNGLEVELGGNAIEQSQQVRPSSSEAIGVIAAAIILFIAFGSLLAMTVPIITALVALGVGVSAISLLSHSLGIAIFAPTLATLIGLGVGIDYALFIITRYSSGLMSGMTPEEATTRALNTAGRAVLFAGSTVCVALLGLLTLGIDFLNGVGVSAALVVLITVLAAITLLPALLGVFGMKILSRKNRKRLKESGPIAEQNVTGIWARNAGFVQNHSLPVAIVALAVMGALIIPYFSLHLGSSDASNDPATSTTYKSYELLSSGFGPGFNGPLQLVATVTTPQQAAAFTKLAETLKSTPGIAQVEPLPLEPGSTVGIIQVVPTTSPESKATSTLIVHLRSDVIPDSTNGTDLHVYVGGDTAIFDDFATVISSKLPLFLGVIIGLSFLILMVAFRSLVIPLTAAAMNLLAAGAAFGVLVMVFQWGWGASILHTGGPGPIESFLPVMMLAILFGLSMDYQVFLVSRMHEEWVHTKNNHQAVRLGQLETGRVITAAATIMILVFLSFVLGGQRIIAEFGIGLGAAVLLDAFVLRNFLVPALMHMFGNSNWWLPKWLDNILPHLAVEPADEVGA